MNRAKTSCKSRLLSFPKIVITNFLFCCLRHGVVVRGVSVAVIMLVLGVCVCGLAGAQSIKFERLTVEKAENGFVVKGAVQGSGLNDVGIVESDRVLIVADIKKNANAQYQLLPESMFIRDPAGSVTPYTKGSGPANTMTKPECYGIDIKSINITSFGLRKEPVWRAYGGIPDWSKCACNCHQRVQWQHPPRVRRQDASHPCDPHPPLGRSVRQLAGL